MTTGVITPGEAWEEMEHLKITVAPNYGSGEWYAHTPADGWQIGWGATPLEAIGNLLTLIGEAAAAKAEAANG